MRAQRRFTSLSFLTIIAALWLSGCPNPSLYTTPRTVAPGSFVHSITLEGFGYIGESKRPDDPRTPANEEAAERRSGFTPTLPSYQLRIGVLPTIDIGIHIHNLSSLGADFKWNPIRGFFDLAIDPAFQYFTIGNTVGPGESITAHVFYFHAPVLLAINPTEWMSVVMTPGFTYGFYTGQVVGADMASTIKGALFRGSLGLQFRIWENFAIHPEASILKALEGPGITYNVGVGFNFGSLPSYEDRKK
jgi:hypothetical protein